MQNCIKNTLYSSAFFEIPFINGNYGSSHSNGPWPVPSHSVFIHSKFPVDTHPISIISMKIYTCINEKSQGRDWTDIIPVWDDRLFSGHWLVRYTVCRALRVRIVRRFVCEEHIPWRPSYSNSHNGSRELLPRLCARAYNETIQVLWAGYIVHVTSWNECLLASMNWAQLLIKTLISDGKFTICVFHMTLQLGW